MTDLPHHRGSPFGRLLRRFHVEGGLGRLTYAAGVEIRTLKPEGNDAEVAGDESKRIGPGARGEQD